MTQASFDDRYGDGAFARLLQQLAQPCVSFADIAEAFGVSRERVRQWHRRFQPDAPTGHERRRLCAVQRRRRRVFEDPVFRTFFQRARAYFGPGRIEPIRSRTGYRARTVLIDKRVVALRDASATAHELPSGFRYRGAAEYIFVRLDEREFLFAPARVLTGPVWRERGEDPRFRNSFASFAQESRLPAGPAPALSLKPIDSID